MFCHSVDEILKCLTRTNLSLVKLVFFVITFFQKKKKRKKRFCYSILLLIIDTAKFVRRSLKRKFNSKIHELKSLALPIQDALARCTRWWKCISLFHWARCVTCAWNFPRYFQRDFWLENWRPDSPPRAKRTEGKVFFSFFFFSFFFSSPPVLISRILVIKLVKTE